MALLRPEEPTAEASRPSQILAGYLAAVAIFCGIVSLFYFPGRLGPAAIVIALVAAGMGTAIRRFAAFAAAVACTGWLVGMIIAVLLDRPII